MPKLVKVMNMGPQISEAISWSLFARSRPALKYISNPVYDNSKSCKTPPRPLFRRRRRQGRVKHWLDIALVSLRSSCHRPLLTGCEGSSLPLRFNPCFNQSRPHCVWEGFQVPYWCNLSFLLAVKDQISTGTC